MTMPEFATHRRRATGGCPRSDRRCRALVLALASLLFSVGTAHGDIPIVYHSPADDGVPLAAPLDVPPGASLTLFLYLDGGSEPSSEIRCATGTGDEVCFWNVVLQGAGTVTISSFTPNPGILHHQSGATIGINGGDPWRGDLGPRRIGEMEIDGGAFGGALQLVSGEAVDSSLGVSALVPTDVVPEPAVGLALGLDWAPCSSAGSRAGERHAPRALRRTTRPPSSRRAAAHSRSDERARP